MGCWRWSERREGLAQDWGSPQAGQEALQRKWPQRGRLWLSGGDQGCGTCLLRAAPSLSSGWSDPGSLHETSSSGHRWATHPLGEVPRGDRQRGLPREDAWVSWEWGNGSSL